jgi:hypothetical protein
MKSVFFILMLGALLLVAWLTVRDMAGDGQGQDAALTVINKAQDVRAKTGDASRQAEQNISNALKE